MTENTQPAAAADILEQLGARVRKLRAERHLSQTDLAAAAGMSQKYLSRVETGGTNVSFRNVARIALAFDVSLGDLLSGIDISQVALENRPYVRGDGAD